MSESGLACQRCVRALGGGTYGDIARPFKLQHVHSSLSQVQVLLQFWLYGTGT